MGNQFPVPFEYPVKPTWDFLADSELYFPYLPPDIINYVLMPYLVNPQWRDPVNQGWLKKPIFYGGYSVNADQVVCLQGGDLLYCDGTDYVFRRVDPRQADSETTYGFPTTILSECQYDFPQDTLYLQDQDDDEETENYLEVPDISQVYEDDFEASPVDQSVDNQLKLGLFHLKWSHGCYRVQVMRGKKVVRTYNFPELLSYDRPSSISYYGGYLLLNVRIHDGRDYGNIVRVYRLIE